MLKGFWLLLRRLQPETNVHGHPRAKFNSTALFKKTKYLHEIRDIVIFKLTKRGLGCASVVGQLMSLFEALDCSVLLKKKKKMGEGQIQEGRGFRWLRELSPFPPSLKT